ncbi:MAG: DedA family protein, partial [Gemmatimonadota bacterium]|nr:DedA family protein [Gemmatimonadota bacterium]
MSGFVDPLIGWIQGLPGPLVYLVISVFAGLENVFPPVPADMIALTGGFLAGRGTISPVGAFLAVWGANVATALLVYWVGRRYGASFFQGRVGRAILQPQQMEKLAALYAKHGSVVIFVSRFLPGFRAVVPIFAGTSGLGWVRTAVPVALASAVWYGVVV